MKGDESQQRKPSYAASSSSDVSLAKQKPLAKSEIVAISTQGQSTNSSSDRAKKSLNDVDSQLGQPDYAMTQSLALGNHSMLSEEDIISRMGRSVADYHPSTLVFSVVDKQPKEDRKKLTAAKKDALKSMLTLENKKRQDVFLETRQREI